ncbi:hypothetical protein BS78_05G200400 [Paspalum vaginatum]|nr:hypothetical protein BS78_05G200400 [Paspalum vaginatum]
MHFKASFFQFKCFKYWKLRTTRPHPKEGETREAHGHIYSPPPHALCSEASPAGRLLRHHRSSHSSEAVDGYRQVAFLPIPRPTTAAAGHQQRPSSHTWQQPAGLRAI